jgi:carbon monoxide dehydrogenase subunit G
VPTARRSRTIAASAHELWEVIRDPYHLSRWWPRVTRVEDVDGDAFTEVMATAKGKLVRADFHVVAADERAHSLRWEQRVQGTPFARVLKSAETEVCLAPATPMPRQAPRVAGGQGGAGVEAVAGEQGGARVEGAGGLQGGAGVEGDAGVQVGAGAATQVTIELRQSLNGFFSHFGSFMVRRAAAATIDEALDGLERISG